MKEFIASEEGAVTVDWVVLTAAIVGLGLAVATVVSGGMQNLSGDIDTQLEATEVAYNWGGDTGLSILNEGAIHSRHGGGWMEGTVAGWSDPNVISDADLIALHQDSATFVAQQEANGITNRQEYETRIDYLGATEAAMANRGIDVPAADTDYTTALTTFRNS